MSGRASEVTCYMRISQQLSCRRMLQRLNFSHEKLFRAGAYGQASPLVTDVPDFLIIRVRNECAYPISAAELHLNVSCTFVQIEAFYRAPDELRRYSSKLIVLLFVFDLGLTRTKDHSLWTSDVPCRFKPKPQLRVLIGQSLDVNG